MRKLFIVDKKWELQRKYSGYEKIVDYLDNFELIVPSNIPYTIAKRFVNLADHKSYSNIAFKKEVSLIRKSIGSNIHIHYLYGDMDFHYGGYLKLINPKIKVTATFHHPPYELVNRNISGKFLSKLDGAIVMGPNQIEYFSQWIKNKPVEFIPHGIDTSYFSPSAVNRDKNKIAIIGISHRNYDLTNKAISAIKETFPEVHFEILGDPSFYKENSGHHIRFLKKPISDEELLEVYHTSACVLLLLDDCTASNVLLESIATGCPLIISDVGAVSSYVSNDSAFLVNNLLDVTEAYRHIYNEDDIVKHKVHNGVLLSKELDWGNIVKKTFSFFEKV